MTVCRICAWLYFVCAGELVMAGWFVPAALMFSFAALLDVFSRFESLRACIVAYLRWTAAQPTPVKILVIVLHAIPVGILIEASRPFARWWDGLCDEAFG